MGTSARHSGRGSLVLKVIDSWMACHERNLSSYRPLRGGGLDQVGIMLTVDVYCLATYPASNCVLTLIEDLSGDAQGSVPILLSLLHATHSLNQKLWFWVPFFFASRPLLVVIRGTLTQHQYVNDILRTVLLPFLLQYPDLIFQQENARPHTARVAMNCLTACKTFHWPARSPGISPNEHVWDMMGRRRHLPKNVDDLARQLVQIWQEISQETIRVFYHSMSRRAAACIQATGGSTSY
ncbi:transposable element Tc1 transposase [Trichonephila clavipes]|nr:transposable element Tc1 transposase [Trichonephila clavipes]